MPDTAVYLLVVHGFADWEPAHAVAELRRHGSYRVEVVGLTREPVISMGGLTVHPTQALEEVDPDDVAVFIMPGGDRWEGTLLERELVELLQELQTRHIPIAAICGATVAVARAGLIKGRRHTSNGRAYLEQHVQGYQDGEHYVDAPAVRDHGLITASGLADVEFAACLFDQLEVLTRSERALWTSLFRSGRMPTGKA